MVNIKNLNLGIIGLFTILLLTLTITELEKSFESFGPLLIVTIILIIYFTFLCKSKIDYKGWIKASFITNILGFISMLLIGSLSIIGYLNCPTYDYSERALSFAISIGIGLIISGIFLLIGLILYLIGFITSKTGSPLFLKK